MKVVTSGSAYLDIDAYAGCIGYAELLNLQGEQAEASSSAPLNESVTDSIRKLGAGLVAYIPGVNDKFVLVDISVEKFFDPIVKNGEVVEVIDHHPGQERYWQDKIGNKADIEFIGASCTQIFERWQDSEKLEAMNPDTARMLAAGILDNTLNFNASVTTERDRTAYAELSRVGSLPGDFASQYFSECQNAIETDLKAAIQNDIKEMDDQPYLPRAMGQLTVWDGKAILRDKLNIIRGVMAGVDEDWALNLISISDGKSYFIADHSSTQAKFEVLLGVEFFEGVATADRLWLRKEILKEALSK